jgi:hypothetical protein
MRYTYQLGMTKRTKTPEDVLSFLRKAGQMGGLKRAENLTAEQRSEQARKAVQTRWAKARADAGARPKAAAQKPKGRAK